MVVILPLIIAINCPEATTDHRIDASYGGGPRRPACRETAAAGSADCPHARGFPGSTWSSCWSNRARLRLIRASIAIGWFAPVLLLSTSGAGFLGWIPCDRLAGTFAFCCQIGRHRMDGEVRQNARCKCLEGTSSYLVLFCRGWHDLLRPFRPNVAFGQIGTETEETFLWVWTWLSQSRRQAVMKTLCL
jgi:hypothetical protein